MPGSTGVQVDLKDGRKHKLRIRFGVRAAGLVEEKFGNRPFSLLVQDGASIKFVSVCLWAGTAWMKDAGPDFDEVCDWIDEYVSKGNTYLDLFQPILAALIDGGIVKRRQETNGEDLGPNAEAETAAQSPSPLGGTTESR